MKKIISVVGARPQFIKLDPSLPQMIVHTGQHFDDEMSAIFFRDLKLKKPRYNLGCNQNIIGNMINKLEEVINKEKPGLIIVFGDTNSTAAGAIAAYQQRIPLAHIEAGVRSYNRQMLEEYNRVLTDHLADFNFCPTKTALNNLKKEGITNSYFVGDVMYDRILKQKIKLKTTKSADYIFLTCHRAELVDNKESLKNIFSSLSKVDSTILFPIHPRTKKMINKYKINLSANIKVIKPLSHLETLKAISQAKMVITDSGGIQKEAYFLNKPCLIIRNETEWPEIVDNKSVFLIPLNRLSILPQLAKKKLPGHKVNTKVFGNGKAWKKIKIVLKKDGYL